MERQQEEERTPFGRTSVSCMSDEDFSTLKKKVVEAAENLKTKGWAMIPNLFTSKECQEFRRLVWDFLDRIGLKEDLDYKGMKASSLLPHTHGIMHAHRMNHAAPFRDMRKHPKVLAVYSMLNGSSCLTSSLDRVNLKFPGRPYRSKESWAHVDQNPRNLGLRYVQSYVTFYEGNENSPQNRFYEGSHLVFDKFFENRRTKSTKDAWIRLTPEDRVSIVKDYKCPLVKPTCPAGSMIMWDSRMIHDPDEGSDFEDGRLVVYLCYSKCFEEMKDGFKTKKRNAFSNFRATPHAPYPQTVFPKTQRTYGKEASPYAEIEASKLGYPLSEDGKCIPDEWEKYLFCFEDYKTNLRDRNDKRNLYNPLEKQWFGEHRVVPDNGKPLLNYTPFSVGCIPYEDKETKTKERKGGKRERATEKTKEKPKLTKAEEKLLKSSHPLKRKASQQLKLESCKKVKL